MIIKSYQYLYESCQNLLDRERLKVNRERIAERGTKGKDGKGSAYAAAIGKGKGKKVSRKEMESLKSRRASAMSSRPPESARRERTVASSMRRVETPRVARRASRDQVLQKEEDQRRRSGR